jgi:two-component system OmpR family response regulator
MEENERPLPASGPEEVLRYFAAGEPSLTLLHLRLGRADGFNQLQEIKAGFDMSVIIVTGQCSDETVLTQRDKCRNAASVVPRKPEYASYKFAGWTLDQRRRQLCNPAGKLVTLTKSEYNLLIAFLLAPGKPLTREDLLQATRLHEDIFDRSVDVQVLRLRRKLETDPTAPRIIQTKRGVGYRLAIPVERL